MLTFAGDPLSEHRGDAIVCAVPGAVVGVRSADCLPILLSADDGRVVAAVHAGWRGTVARVGPATVALLERDFGVPPNTLTAALGPCIRRCCYQVGDELIDAVREGFGEGSENLFQTRDERIYFDLARLNRMQLNAAGVTQIIDAGECTCCQPHKYESYRRDGVSSGRMISWIRAASPPQVARTG